MSNSPSASEPRPVGGDVPIADLVMKDIQERTGAGEKKYGTKLKAHNGRRPLVDAYQEAIDLVMYLRQEILERYGK